MDDKVTNVLFAGIGGQGIIKASDLLTEAAFRMGFDVKKSELHGMSQRGGSVSSDVRFGGKVFSPMIPRGEADFLLAVTEDQIEVCAEYLRPDAVIIRPSDFSDEIANSKMLNTAMLGRLNQYLKFPETLWVELLRGSFKAEIAESNLAVFRQAAGIGG